MPLLTKVKAGSITSLSDARFFAGMGVDWLGFDIDPNSDSFVNLELYKSMAGWVSGPKRVIQFHGTPDKRILETAIQECVPDFVEVDLSTASSVGVAVPLFVRSSLSNVNPSDIKRGMEYIILELDTDPFGKREALAELARSVNILLNIPPSYAQAKRAIHELPIVGIALQGSKELKTGMKVYDYADLLESLEID